MIRFTTPTHTHRIKNVDLSGCDVWVTYQQCSYQLDLKGTVETDGNDTLVTVNFTQEQTASFCEGRVTVQINWVYPDGARDATRQKQMAVGSNLMAREVGYGH